MTKVRLFRCSIVYYQCIFCHAVVSHVHLAAVDQEREIVEHMLEFKWATVLTHIGLYVCVYVCLN